MGRFWKTIKPMFGRCKHWRIVKGDIVQILVGKDRGEVGKVLEVIQDVRKPRVIVEGKNMVRINQPSHSSDLTFQVQRRIPKTIEEPGRIISKEVSLSVELWIISDLGSCALFKCKLARSRDKETRQSGIQVRTVFRLQRLK